MITRRRSMLILKTCEGIVPLGILRPVAWVIASRSTLLSAALPSHLARTYMKRMSRPHTPRTLTAIDPLRILYLALSCALTQTSMMGEQQGVESQNSIKNTMKVLANSFSRAYEVIFHSTIALARLETWLLVKIMEHV
ncbi:UNVERIFIED_CONTAM: hypothetical protein Sradi_3773300 [Sesamum radiatum]|uniref:Secreted protein n=1 Tax=Sesamum radiatum TaxID=300843 RepID=A0AAW2PZG9_SESRA